MEAFASVSEANSSLSSLIAISISVAVYGVIGCIEAMPTTFFGCIEASGIACSLLKIRRFVPCLTKEIWFGEVWPYMEAKNNRFRIKRTKEVRVFFIK